MLEINLLTADVQRALNDLAGRVGDLRPALQAIGENLVESTQRRFATSTAPDGTPWAPNRPVTIARHVHSVKGTKTKDGQFLTKKGAARWDSKKPLIGETKHLSEQIHWELQGKASVFVFSAMEYAAIQQFGAKQGQSGRTRRGAPIPWGDIPARPFFGLSDADQANIERASSWLQYFAIIPLANIFFASI